MNDAFLVSVTCVRSDEIDFNDDKNWSRHWSKKEQKINYDKSSKFFCSRDLDFVVAIMKFVCLCLVLNDF